MRPHGDFVTPEPVRACKHQGFDGQRVQKSPGEVRGAL